MMKMINQLFPALAENQALAFGVALGLLVAYWALYAIAGYRVFKKMGEKGWVAFVPFYNTYVLFKKVWDVKYYWPYLLTAALRVLDNIGFYEPATETATMIMSLSSLVIVLLAIYLGIRLYVRLSKSFGHGSLFGLGIYFFQFIFFLILGLGKSEFHSVNEQ